MRVRTRGVHLGPRRRAQPVARVPHAPDEFALAMYSRIRELAQRATQEQLERMAAGGAELTNLLVAEACSPGGGTGSHTVA